MSSKNNHRSSNASEFDARGEAASTVDYEKLSSQLDRECRELFAELSQTRRDLAKALRDGKTQMTAHAEVVAELSRINDSTLLKIWRRISIVRGVPRLIRLATRSKRPLKRLLLRTLPQKRYPLLILTGPTVNGMAESMTLLPFRDWPRRGFPLRGEYSAFEYHFECRVEHLSSASLFLETTHLRDEQVIDVQVLRNGEIIRSSRIRTGQIPGVGPISVTWDPIPDSVGASYTLRVVGSSGTRHSYVTLGVFGALWFKPAPWVYPHEVSLNGQDKIEFLPVFTAQAESRDTTEEVSWSLDGYELRWAALYGHRTVHFSFQAPQEPLATVSVILATRGTPLDARLHIRVSSIGCEWRSEVDAQGVSSNVPFPIPIPISISRQLIGKKVKVELSAPTAIADNQLSILGTMYGAGLRSVQQAPALTTAMTPIPYDHSRGVPLFRKIWLEPLTTIRPRIAVVLNQDDLPALLRLWSKSFIGAATSLGCSVRVTTAVQLEMELKELSLADILVVFPQSYTEHLRRLVTNVKAAYGIVLAGRIEGGVSESDELGAVCSMNLRVGRDTRVSLASSNAETEFVLPQECNEADVRAWLRGAVEAHKRECLPKVSIVTVLYRKEREIPFFLRALAAQDYRGEIELVVVDDQSPDASSALLESTHAELAAQGERAPNLKLLRNSANLGNCGSRNRALKEVTGDVIVVIDCDCLLNPAFVSAHVHSHLFHAADVVIGPCNLESGEKDPLEALADFDSDRPRILREAQLQDPINLDSFVNCITRNFSIRRRHLDEELFDEAFGYSASPDSGFGWEDVEMGYRLYKRGLRIHFTEEAFSVHVSHPSTTDDGVKPLKSLKNYRRLLEKHPTIKDEARRWCLDTFQKIERWSESCGHAVNADQLRLRELVSPMYPYPFLIRKNRGLRVLTYRWHVPHQYELYKLPYQFSLVRDAGTHFVSVWEPEQRPRPRNATFVSVEEIRPQDYDLAILHFDENVLSPENCNGIISPDWGASFKWGLERLTGIPKIAICHGTPQFIGQYQAECDPSELGVVIEDSRKLLVERLADTLVVCNSYQAEREWGFQKSRVIWQGFDPSEFGLTDYAGGVLSLGKAIKERPHYRGYENFRRVSELLPEEMRPCHFSVTRPSLFCADQPEYARLKYEAYKSAIRRYSVYFNPTLRSPMPRSRGEAMMSGLATVSAANHDVQHFIKNGWNGFYADSPEEMAEYIRFLMGNKPECRKIGERGRQTAIDVFNHDRYLHAWQTLVSEVAGK